jgi:hypothetical protein
MGSLKSLAAGFLVATALVGVFNVIVLVQGGDAWVGLLYLLIMLIPASSLTYLTLRKPRSNAQPNDNKWRNFLFAFQGVALGFWMFDLATTFYAINITGLATELNPLGWPLSILGGLGYYGPALAFSYVLLYKLKDNVTFYGTIPMTVITLGMSLMNFSAGAHNFQVFVDTAALATGLRYGLLALVVSVNLAVPLALKRMVTKSKSNNLGLNVQP